MVSATKDPVKVRAGAIGAAKRWGPPRVVSLRDLDPDSRAFIAELIEVARRNRKATPAVGTPGMAQEARRARVERPTAA